VGELVGVCAASEHALAGGWVAQTMKKRMGYLR
jgi:hypothetical protein